MARPTNQKAKTEPLSCVCLDLTARGRGGRNRAGRGVAGQAWVVRAWGEGYISERAVCGILREGGLVVLVYGMLGW